MEFEPQPISTPPPAVSITPEPPEPKRQLVAPIWHTLLILALVLGTSYLGASPVAQDRAPSERALIVQYGVTIVFQFFLLFLVWIGLRLKHVKLMSLIGGRWDSPEDFLLDVALAVGFWVASRVVLVGLAYVLGLADPSQLKETKKLMDMIGPQSGLSMALFILLSCTAGLVEEIIFRGYLQLQLRAMSGNIYVGVVGSAVFFGLGHGYEGARRMVLIAVLGVMFGVLAIWRKSLRPGIMAHALFDSIAGVVLWFARKGTIRLP